MYETGGVDLKRVTYLIKLPTENDITDRTGRTILLVEMVQHT